MAGICFILCTRWFFRHGYCLTDLSQAHFSGLPGQAGMLPDDAIEKFTCSKGNDLSSE